MTRNFSSIIALTFAVLVAGPAMAANTDTRITREQVKIELAQAKHAGNMVYNESGEKLNEVFPHNYPAPQNLAETSRAQVKAELAEAKHAGNMIYGESGVQMNELYPRNYPASQNLASKTRGQVKAELAEARSHGLLNRQIEA